MIMYGEGVNEQDQEVDHPKEFGVNDLCPACTQGHFDYNGVLNLECDECKYTLAGCST